LIDGGCNEGLAGTDVIILEETLEKVNVKGIANVSLNSVPLGTVAGLITTTEGPVIDKWMGTTTTNHLKLTKN
jgi:hypothetical protein